MSEDLLVLQIRNLIAAREFNTAQANQELSREGWLWDHAEYDRQLSAQIDALFAQVKTLPETAATPIPQVSLEWLKAIANDAASKDREI